MRTILTTKCRSYGHPELALSFDQTKLLERDAESFASSLEHMVESGSRFQPGQTIQIGWSIAWCVSQPNGILGFEEPDMKSMPMAKQIGLTDSLRHVRLQKDTLESVLSVDALLFPSLQQSCLVCTRLSNSGKFFMDRSEPRGADSGWFIGCVIDGHNHNDVSNLKKVSLYEAAVTLCPGMLPYLAFPPKTVINFDESPSFSVDGKPVEVRRGSFLDRQYARPDV